MSNAIDTNKKRARANGLCMAEAVPFGQHFIYHGDDGPDDTLAPGYFEAVRDFLRVGDVMRIVEVQGSEVRSVVAGIVTAPGKPGGLDAATRAPTVFPLGAPVIIPPARPATNGKAGTPTTRTPRAKAKSPAVSPKATVKKPATSGKAAAAKAASKKPSD